MLRGRRAAVAAALAIAAVAAVTAGCGGGTTSGALSLDPVAAAATKTQQAGAARIRFAMAIGSPQLPGRHFALRGTGIVDGTSAEMSFNLASMLKALGQAKAEQSGITANLMHESVREVALEQNGDYVIYMRIPFLSSQIPGGKQWIELNLSKLGQSAGLDVGKLISGSQFTPSDLLSMLEAEGADVHKVGPATIDGVATTHYHVDIDLAKVLQSKGLASPTMRSIAAQIKNASDDVWVAKDGLVRRIVTSYGVATAGKQVQASITMDLFDYGAHLTVAAPPSREVFDATQLAKSGIFH